MLAYVDALMSDYHMSYRTVMTTFPLVAGLALMEARHERLSPGSSASFTDRCAIRAIDEEQARIAREFTVVD